MANCRRKRFVRNARKVVAKAAPVAPVDLVVKAVRRVKAARADRLPVSNRPQRSFT